MIRHFAILVLGSLDKNGPWETLLEDQLVDTRAVVAPLLNFTFDKPVEIQFIKFDLISYWGGGGGGLQYFAAIPATSKKHKFCMSSVNKLFSSNYNCNYSYNYNSS